MGDLLTPLLNDTSVAWGHTLPPTRSAALARVARVRPAAYARTRNQLDGAVTGLSPYITHGVLTLADVLRGVLHREPLGVQHKLVFELGWREFFRHAWKHAGEGGNGILASLHPGPLPDTAYSSTLPDDVRHACTGVPAIDEAVRSLYATGTLHNHARMWLASYVVHLRHVHWRAGADWLVAHLLDGDLASNHLSWQWVAGTGSHKPYLFNADNVARYAPAHWHSTGTVVDQTYEALDRVAHGALRLVAARTPGHLRATLEPPRLAAPPADLALTEPDAGAADRLRGRDVWLVHPWALRAPPVGLPAGTVVLGVYLREHHAAWPWPAERWRWVDAAMENALTGTLNGALTGAMTAPTVPSAAIQHAPTLPVTPSQRWFTSAAGLASALAGAASVRSVDDPHITRWLQPMAQLNPAPTLFPAVNQRCHSFSQWWTRATRGLQQAEELL